MADYVLPAVVEKRVRYFDGQFLQDRDFIDEQDYQRDREHRVSRLLHGPGIAEGLAVTSAAPNQVTVAKGTAIDSDGCQLVLAQATYVDLPATHFNDKQGVQLYISYLASAEDPQTGGGSSDFTRWLERPQLTALAPGNSYAGTAPPVLLASLALDNAGRVTVDNSARPYSGVLLPGPGASPASLRTTSGGTVGLGGTLTVDGSLGVGTANPRARLEVAGPGGTSVDLLVNGRMRSDHKDGGLWVTQDRFVGGLETNKIGFYAGGKWRLAVQQNGHVGVGTTSPASPLHVSAPTSGAPFTALQVDVQSFATAANARASYFLNVRDVSAGNSGNYRLCVRGDGNVGVGTGTPGARLEVAGSGGTTVDLLVNGRLRSNNDDGGLWVAQDRFVGGFDKNKIGFFSGGQWRLAVLPTGGVGINTTDTNGQALSVKGTTWLQGDTFITGRLVMKLSDDTWSKFYKTSTVGSTQWAAFADTSGPSDLRLKTDLRPVSHALELVSRLQAVRYRWGDDGLRFLTRDIDDTVCAGPGATSRQDQEAREEQRGMAMAALDGDRIGLVAQDVEAVLPELVQDVDGYKHIRYQHLTALLAEAVKELSGEVAALRAAAGASS